MVADAQAHTEEDKQRREEVEVRNSADSIAYQVERQIQELGDRVPVNDKARAEQLIAEIRELVKKNSSDVARLRQLTSDMQQIASAMLCRLQHRRLRPVRKPAERAAPSQAGREM